MKIVHGHNIIIVEFGTQQENTNNLFETLTMV
jgi:hypothetical protein